MASPTIFCGKENKNDEHDQGQMNFEEVNPILTAWASEYVSPRRKFVACLSDPCKNGGIREEEGGIQRCRCPKYYAGKYCQYCSFFLPYQSALDTNIIPYSNDRTGLKLRTRGIGHTLAFVGKANSKGVMIIFDFCVGSSQVMSTQQTRGEVSSSVLGPVLGQLHCGPSGYDSFWLDHSEGNFAVGLQGNSTPFIKFRPEVQVKINSIGLRVRRASGADWMIDQPCGGWIRS
ncbi:uncharacterized protein LOC121414836 [Lytechinus variegatus]|uniref:uncharacterized protein LOC121414836 n=1 Tax=Lytechinus variegatus TaxID=7654 RepID=UPI001BB2C8AB|nr:uncharacterized protein LOC121414836 [Lytechinus variegatus]